MKIDRTLGWLLVAMATLSALGCGMDAVGTGDRSVPGAPAASGHPSAGSAGAASVESGDAAADSASSIDVGIGSGSAADGGLAMCLARGVTCSVTSECCPGLACTGEDEDRRCN